MLASTQKILTSYLDGIKLRFSVGNQLTDWQKLEKIHPPSTEPSIIKSPIHCLGKWFDASHQDCDNVKKLEPKVETGLKKTASAFLESSKPGYTSMPNY
ncbi:hypothetical protein DPMN_179921 [Dreissena polymorpha]|uniref:Uncharacterized protein n=1 Tax=Dreissena polymorpha TaxID=45954 RepID=A0A9D4IMS4_DREPO|nr:hypothetical protein DPMN_179921 [Dreissena polymorpha]